MNVRRLVCLAAVLLAVGWVSVDTGAQELTLASQVIERVLPNGLKVLMVKRPEAPLIRCILAYRVGSVNERPGITGISHFHEHMMFKGTRSMGIKPGTLAKDDEYNRQIDALMDQVAAEDAKVKGRDEAKLAALKKQVSELIDREKKETIVSEEILGRLPGGRRHEHQRLHRQRDDAVLRDAAEECPRALSRARSRPHGQPGVPRVLLGARRHHRGTADERERRRLLLPGAAECDVLRGQPVFLGGAGLDVGHQPGDQAGDDRVPREVLSPGQCHTGAGGRSRSGEGDAARGEVLRPDQVEGEVAPSADRGAVAGVLQANRWPELQAAVHREARHRPRGDQSERDDHVPHPAGVARRPPGADHAGQRDERAHREDVHWISSRNSST